jgi:signal transduction histidine kinase
MLREIDRLERDLTNLLVAAGLEAPSKVRGRAVRGDLADDVRRAVEQFGARFAAAGVECRVLNLDPCLVDRDEGSIRIVLHNLLDNGVKYNVRGGHVAISLEKRGHKARLTVTDDGCGIPKHELDRVFTRFHRGATHDHVGGTGLGLAIVKELVEAHDGRVRAESEGAGNGARFTIDLPLALREDAA